jgi:hypothetical protein
MCHTVMVATKQPCFKLQHACIPVILIIIDDHFQAEATLTEVEQ